VLIVQREVPVDSKKVTVIRVKDSRKAMAAVGHVFYGFPSEKLRIIGVTGTNGKTTTTYLIKSILENAGHSVGLMGTIAIRIGDREIPALRTTPESLDLHRLFAEMVEGGTPSISSISMKFHKSEICIAITSILLFNYNPVKGFTANLPVPRKLP
jgi:UDP-N-acetylmuramoyl-L-alanyl-D-glutamate--2,6-diaminopimelate ligase